MAERLTIRISSKYESKGVYISRVPFGEVTHALGRYEDLAEQGRLIELPCKLGETLWIFDPDINLIEDFKVTDIDITERGIGICNHYLGFYCDVNDFGKTVFLTKEEAEAKLAEMRGAE